MDRNLVFAKDLSKADALVLRNLEADIKDVESKAALNGNGTTNGNSELSEFTFITNAFTNACAMAINCTILIPKPEQRRNANLTDEDVRDEAAIATMTALNDPKSSHFEPSVFNNWDLSDLKPSPVLDRLLKSYVNLGNSVVRHETDVVFLTHLILYFTTSVPSALWLFYHFNWFHGVFHTIMQVSYTGTYTLMMHQHIHGRGILQKQFGWFDGTFPYLLDPLMGHTWNSYFYHHVKHHHVEGNGPNDLSSTIRYQRDSLLHFLHYVGRFYFFVGFELPLYFLKKAQYVSAAKVAFWEFGNYAMIWFLFTVNARAATFVVLLPLMVMRFGLMIGNWGQHALVDRDEPDSDYRSSITLIDVPVSSVHQG